MKIILFDFDGVLANTNELAFNIHKVKNEGLTWKDFQEYAIGNFHEGIEKAKREKKHVEADDFYGQYKKGLNEINIQESLRNLISSLSKNYKLAIVSSTSSSYIEDFLKKENILEYFSDILGSDIHKSKVFKIKSVLEKYNILPKEAIFITDTTGDVIEARGCDVGAICVSWGLHDREMLEKEKPFALVDTPEELGQKIEEFF